MNGTWEDLALGQYCESVVKVCYVVLRLDFVKVVWFETLELHGWVEGGHRVGLGGSVDLVEELVENSWS